MADAGLFIGWGEVVRGRETEALEVFNETLAYYGRLQEEGAIESFEPVFLEPHGGDLSGFILIRGTPRSSRRCASTRSSTTFIDAGDAHRRRLRHRRCRPRGAAPAADGVLHRADRRVRLKSHDTGCAAAQASAKPRCALRSRRASRRRATMRGRVPPAVRALRRPRRRAAVAARLARRVLGRVEVDDGPIAARMVRQLSAAALPDHAARVVHAAAQPRTSPAPDGPTCPTWMRRQRLAASLSSDERQAPTCASPGRSKELETCAAGNARVYAPTRTPAGLREPRGEPRDRRSARRDLGFTGLTAARAARRADGQQFTGKVDDTWSSRALRPWERRSRRRAVDDPDRRTCVNVHTAKNAAGEIRRRSRPRRRTRARARTSTAADDS